jgi:hypothetical protein
MRGLGAEIEILADDLAVLPRTYRKLGMSRRAAR